jgi:hypothetical protein
MHLPLVLAALLSAAATPPPLTVDEIVARYVEARGGTDKLAALQTLKVTGRVFFGGGDDFSITAQFAQVLKRPDQIRREITLQGLTAIDAYDGKESWSVDPFQGRKDPFRTTADEARGLAQDADFEGALVRPGVRKGIRSAISAPRTWTARRRTSCASRSRTATCSTSISTRTTSWRSAA